MIHNQNTAPPSPTSTFMDYSVSAPAPSSALVGSLSTTIVSLTSSTRFIGQVTLTINPTESVSCNDHADTFLTTLSVPGSLALMCTATREGSYSIYITAASGSISHSILVQFAFRLRTTELSVGCSPSTLIQGQGTSSCTASITDTSASPMVLTGSVGFSYNSSNPYFLVPCPSGSGDCYSDATHCTLVSTGTCSVQFGSSGTSSPAPATYLISAFFFGDKFHAPSQGRTDLTFI